jgi:hypothetical protein
MVSRPRPPSLPVFTFPAKTPQLSPPRSPRLCVTIHEHLIYNYSKKRNKPAPQSVQPKGHPARRFHAPAPKKAAAPAQSAQYPASLPRFRPSSLPR